MNLLYERFALIIPALNPDDSLPAYVQECRRSGFSHIIVIDDGSDAACADIFAELEKDAEVLRHSKNCGKGRALKTAFSFCLQQADVWELAGVITVDSDGQHRIADVCRMAEAMDGSSLVLGCRELFGEHVPPKSRFGNQLTCRVFRMLYGTWISDTQTGLRGIPRAHLELFAHVSGERYEYETQMLIVATKNQIRMKEVPIETIYIEENAGTHFRPVVDSVKIYAVLFGSFLWYLASSLSAAVLDELGFFLFNHFLFAWMAQERRIFFATVVARIISSAYNFTVNRRVAFRSNGRVGVQLLKYYGLAIVQMLLSAGLVILLVKPLPFGDTAVKILVDIVLFFASYQIQKRWIFQDRKDADCNGK